VPVRRWVVNLRRRRPQHPKRRITSAGAGAGADDREELGPRQIEGSALSPALRQAWAASAGAALVRSR
jgi:hypothetical protein